MRQQVLSRDSPSAAQSAQCKASGLYHCSNAWLLPTQKRFPATSWELALDWQPWDSDPAWMVAALRLRENGRAFGAWSGDTFVSPDQGRSQDVKAPNSRRVPVWCGLPGMEGDLHPSAMPPLSQEPSCAFPLAHALLGPPAAQ